MLDNARHSMLSFEEALERTLLASLMAFLSCRFGRNACSPLEWRLTRFRFFGSGLDDWALTSVGCCDL